MEFSLKDYMDRQIRSEFFFPTNFSSYRSIDRRKYKILEDQHLISGLNISQTFDGLRSRTGKVYFNKVYPAQSAALNFSETAFPAYRFLMPDVLIDDWLAVVDFHKSFNRDHALHQPLTAYIVYLLLGGGINNKSLNTPKGELLDLCTTFVLVSDKTKYLRDFFSNLYPESTLLDGSKQSFMVWKSIFFETAMIAAIFHDNGYPRQYINQLNASIKTSDFNVEQVNSNAKFVKERFKNRLIMYPFYGYQSALTNIPFTWEETLIDLIKNALYDTHGFPGALGFLYLNDLIKRFPESKKYEPSSFCIEWAAMAIMMHDMKKIYKGKSGSSSPENKFMRLSFELDPLSCIITLADILQDFERPNVKFNINKIGSTFDYEFACESVSLDINNNTMNIYYYFKSEEDRKINIPYKAKDERDYFEKSNGYLDLSGIGINNVELSCNTK